MGFDDLNARERKILQHLINHYVLTADPVGSRVIAQKYRMGLSPATIRNTMQDLEEMGLIRQPHTSAGRVPTDSGYRVFVDMLLKEEPLSSSEKARIRKIINQNRKGIDSILSQTSRILAEITNQLGISIAPKFEESVFTRINLIPVSEGRILVVVAVKSGLARSILMEAESDVDHVELIKMEEILNERLTGLTLGQIQKTVSERLSDTRCSPRLVKLFLDPSSDIWSDIHPAKLHLGGTDRLISQPEFSDRGKLAEFVKFLEDKESLVQLLESKSIGEGLVITIGSENAAREIRNCSLVTTSYQAGRLSGIVGIIGPTRMPYSKLISIVQYTARSLTDALSEA